MICPKEKTDELMIYNKDNNFIKTNLKSKGIKCNVKIDIFPFKSKYVNLGQSLLLTGGMIEEEILNKCYLMSVIKTKNKLDYKIIINSYGDLIEKRERHNIIFIPDKNLVFICSGYLTDKCEYTDLSKGIWEEIVLKTRSHGLSVGWLSSNSSTRSTPILSIVPRTVSSPGRNQFLPKNFSIKGNVWSKIGFDTVMYFF